MNSDFSDLLSLFNRHRVRYLVAGGYAVIYYTNPQYTRGLDVVVALTGEDTRRAADALKEFGFALNDGDLAELRIPNRMIVLWRPPSRIDVLNGIDGIDFDEAYPRREMVTIRGEDCPFISLEDQSPRSGRRDVRRTNWTSKGWSENSRHGEKPSRPLCAASRV